MMNKVICVKNKDYTSISNLFFRDKKLSLKAKGLLALVMTLPSDWDFSISGIEKIIKEGKTSIYSTIDELKEYGYCTVSIVRSEKGTILGNDYSFYENPHLDNPYMENPNMDNPNMDNQPQQNIDNNKIKIKQSKDIIKENNIKESKFSDIELAEMFTQFVRHYAKVTGKRTRSPQTEFKEFKERHKDWRDVVPYLKTAIDREMFERKKKMAQGEFFAQPKMLQTYIGKQRAWELYVTIGEDLSKDDEYSPELNNLVYYNEYYKCYFYSGYFDGVIPDGYKDEDRPDGAMITLNAGRGTYMWSKEQSKWIKK